MIVKRRLGEKGQVVISKDVRQMLGLKERERVIFEIKDNKIRIKAEQNAEEFI